MAHPTAAIVVIGDEILSGKYVEENARHAIGELRALGVALRRIEVIPDDVGEIAAAVSRLAARVDHVVTSGGVGPTHDDLTMAGIARGFGVPLVEHPRFLALLARFYGEPLSAAHRRLAEVPAGSELVETADGRAPIVRFRNVFILPGVPSMFRRKLAALAELLRAPPFLIGRVYLAVDETAIAERLTAVAAAHPAVAIGSYPRFDQDVFELILTIEGKERAAVEAAIAALAEALGDLIHRVEPPG